MRGVDAVLVSLCVFLIAAVSKSLQSCERIKAPQNSKIKIYPSAYYVRCNPGYKLHGKKLVKCTNGTWETMPPKCSKEGENACKNLSPPANGSKECDEGLITLGTACRFKCLDGFRLEGVSERRCMEDFKWSGQHPKCVSESTSNGTCAVPPELKNGRVVGCSPNKVPKTGSSCHFFCNEGYTRSGPSSLHCQANGKLLDTDGKESYPKCVELTQNQPADDNVHQNSFQSLSSNNPSRQPTERPKRKPTPKPIIHRFWWKNGSCQNNNGGCEHICNESGNRFYCSCQSGYKLASDGKTCLDIDECAIRNSNNCQQKCQNIVGGYTCSCNEGYVLVDGNKCEACIKDYYWQEGRCLECPKNSYTKFEASLSINDCLCLPGFNGDSSNNIECQDINECDDENYGCSDKCVNTPGSAYCSCQIGYTVDIDNKTCIDLDECSIKNGGCQGICHNLDGSFYCSCPEGFKQSNKDQYSCDDINECVQNNGGCAHKCHNHDGGYYCSCEKGYRLDSGRHNCTDIRCIVPPVPHHTIMKCKKNNKKVNNASESYTVGTQCFFSCAKGFKILTESNKTECQADGTWSGQVPECKSQQCPPLPVPENGEVHPASCATSGNFVKQKCTFTCHPGHQLKTKSGFVFTCTNKLEWSKKEIPECKPVKFQPNIKCPADITVNLLRGQKKHEVTLAAPETNVDEIKIEPDWVSISVPVSFPAGTTNVIFTASIPNTNRFARCTTIVNVKDNENPVFEFCPPSIQKDVGGPYGIPVEWNEPQVTDNVAIESLESTMSNNSTLLPGTYAVKYTARDTQGNIATCRFDIIINRIQCADLSDPKHGRANCMHFRSGKFCQPECDEGFIRHPADPDSFMCGESGNWVPTEIISDCLRYISPGPTGCPDGFELEENIETEEFICIESV